MSPALVCLICSVEVAIAVTGRAVHIEAIPKGADDHDALAGTREERIAGLAIHSMPAAVKEARERAAEYRAQMADPAMDGVVFSRAAMDLVALLGEVERLETR